MAGVGKLAGSNLWTSNRCLDPISSQSRGVLEAILGLRPPITTGRYHEPRRCPLSSLKASHHRHPIQKIMLACSIFWLALGECTLSRKGYMLAHIEADHQCKASIRTSIVLCNGLSPPSIAFSPHQASRSLSVVPSSSLHSMKLV